MNWIYCNLNVKTWCPAIQLLSRLQLKFQPIQGDHWAMISNCALSIVIFLKVSCSTSSTEDHWALSFSNWTLYNMYQKSNYSATYDKDFKGHKMHSKNCDKISVYSWSSFTSFTKDHWAFVSNWILYNMYKTIYIFCNVKQGL